MKEHPTRHPLDEQIIEQVLRDKSGYPFELEIARRVAAAGYTVEPNYSFEDHDSGESRELDFHAFALKPANGKSEAINVAILASCKNNQQPYVFFTRKPLLSRSFLESDLPIGGYPLEIYENDFEKYALEEYLELHKLLHIGKADTVSSQFCEIAQDGNGQYKVGSGSIFKDAFIPLIKAMSREMEEFNKWHPLTVDSLPIYGVCYPLLVVNGPLFEYYFPPQGSPTLKKAEHIVLSRAYRSKTVACHYAIDVIHESYLGRYLDLIDGEIRALRNRIRRHKSTLEYTIKRIVEMSHRNAKTRAL